MAGFPTPDDVRAWWYGTFPPGGGNRGDQSNNPAETGHSSDTYEERSDHR